MKSTNRMHTDLNWVFLYMKTGAYPSGLTISEKRIVRKRAETFCFVDDELYFVGTPKTREAKPNPRKVILSHEEKWQLVEEAHVDPEGTHLGLERCMEILGYKFYWVAMYKFVRDFIRQCKTCLERHPQMNQSSSQASSIDEEATPSVAGSSSVRRDESLDGMSSIADDESSIYEVSSVVEEDFGANREPVRAFWDKVDVRLFGPYKSGGSQKYVFSTLDHYSLWPELFILDTLSPASIALCLLKLICRYGQMKQLVMSQTDAGLEMALTTSLDILRQSGSLHIELIKETMGGMTENTYQELAEIVETFVVNNPECWMSCLEYCLLPLRASCPERAEYSPSYLAHGREPLLPVELSHRPDPSMESHLSKAEMCATTDILVNIHNNATSSQFTEPCCKLEDSSQVFLSPGQSSVGMLSPVSSQGEKGVGGRKSGMTTRSRTGISKSKVPDPETYTLFSPASKRKLSQTSPGPVTSTPAVKKVKKEAGTDDTGSGDDSDTSEANSTRTESKALGKIDLDSYYEAIILYVTKAEYQPNKSRGFKRVIRGAAKNYSFEEGSLFYTKGSKGVKKRVITAKGERFAMMKEAHVNSDGIHLCKSRVIENLGKVFWKSITLDCEAYILACPDCDNGDVKTKLAAQTRSKDMLDKEELRDMKKDTMTVYESLEHYIFSSEFPENLDETLLADLKKLARQFKLMDGHLHHVMGAKKQKVVTDIGERRDLIFKFHESVKDKHLEGRAALKLMLEKYFWFGMKVDVFMYTSLCCDMTSEKLSPERTLQRQNTLEKYFLFREVLMRPDSIQSSNVNSGEKPAESVESSTITEDAVKETEEDDIVPLAEITASEGGEERPSGIFIASSQVGTGKQGSPSKPESESAADSGQDNLDTYDYDMAVTLKSADGPLDGEGSTFTEVVMSANPSSSVVVTSVAGGGGATASGGGGEEGGGGGVSESVVPGESTQTESDAETDGNEKVQTVVVQLNETGEAVVVRTETMEEGGKSSKLSDPVTMAAVESILPGMTPGGDAGRKKRQVIRRDFVTDLESDEEEEDDEDDEEELDEDELDEDEEEMDDEDIETKPSLLNESEAEKSFEGSSRAQNPSLELLQFMKISEGLERQETQQHKVTTPRQALKCNICSKVMYGPIKFKMHMYRHTGQKPFGCDVCGKKYTNNKSLTIHARTHTGEMPFLCSLCGKRTPSKMSLRSHIKTHEKGGGMPADCDICGRGFARKHLMERHKHFKHTNLQTQFKCAECSKVFGHQRSLKRHIMSHHMGVKNHICELCGKGFYRKEYLTSHMLQHTGGTGDKPLRKPRMTAALTRKTHSQERLDDSDDEDASIDEQNEPVQRIVLHQDASGNLRVVDVAMERQVKRLLQGKQISQGNALGEAMVVEIGETGDGEQRTVVLEQPSQQRMVMHVGEDNQSVIHMEEGGVEEQEIETTTEEQVLHVPIESQSFIVDAQDLGGTTTAPTYVAVNASGTSSATSGVLSFAYATSQGEAVSGQGSQELMYGQPAVQYEVECVGEVGDEEALSAINLLAQASVAQYENVVVSNI